MQEHLDPFLKNQRKIIEDLSFHENVQRKENK